MVKIFLLLPVFFLTAAGCNDMQDSKLEDEISVKYNTIEPGNGIYVIKDKNLSKEEVSGKNHETVYYKNGRIIKVERYNDEGMLTDGFGAAAETRFEYDSNSRVKFVKYFDQNGNNREDTEFGYWSIEYIYDEKNNVRMEIYRDAESKFLAVPRDKSGNIAKVNFIAPVLTYEYLDSSIVIKALDKNFNLLKEIIGEKPCIPFIDCGELN